MEIPILFEDDFLLVLDKPVGISVVEEEGRGQKQADGITTVKDWVRNKFGYTPYKGGTEGEFEQRLGIVHRLDKETSGVLLIAKTKEVFDYLKGLFKFRRMQKEYQALCYGTILDERFEVSAPIGRNKISGTSYGVDTEGRESTTEFRVLGRYRADDSITDGIFKSTGVSFPATYLNAYPKTGRTHQIRVHLKAFGHPVVNDHKYASRVLLESSKNLSNRMMLHAKSVTFVDWDGKNRLFQSPINLLDFIKR